MRLTVYKYCLCGGGTGCGAATDLLEWIFLPHLIWFFVIIIIFQVPIAGPIMIPFVKTVCMYFALGAHSNNGEYWTTAMKCAPIVSLIIFIVLYESQLPKRWVPFKPETICQTNDLYICWPCRVSIHRSTYAHNILLGLGFSCLGDALLNHGHFAPGMATFGIAQIFYILAFQTQSLKLWIAGILYSGGIASKCSSNSNLICING